MTQFTSFVAVEEMIVTDGGVPRCIDVPLEVPEGVNRDTAYQERLSNNVGIVNAPTQYSFMVSGTASVSKSGTNVSRAKTRRAAGGGGGIGAGGRGSGVAGGAGGGGGRVMPGAPAKPSPIVMADVVEAVKVFHLKTSYVPGSIRQCSR
ncbi:MAG: hypothetical protein ABR501_09355 [Pyrinomonadaceae bacterium]